MIITRAPLRISFAGGGTDLPAFYENNGYGCVISTSIDKYVYVTVNHKFDGKLSVRYRKHEVADNVDELEHKLIQAILKSYGIKSGVEIVIASDVPARGSGLGASSSLTVALCLALEVMIGNDDILSDKERLANHAATIEIYRANSIIGKQDQYASAFGGFNFVRFSKQSVSVKPFKKSSFLNEIEDQSMLFYLNMEHRYEDTHYPVIRILKEQHEEMATKLGIYTLQRDNAMRLYENMDYEIIERFMDHVNENWRLKRSLHKDISTPKIDAVIQRAMRKGATAAKLCGAGGGGFLYLMVPQSMKNEVRKELTEFPELKFKFDFQGAQLLFSDHEKELVESELS